MNNIFSARSGLRQLRAVGLLATAGLCSLSFTAWATPAGSASPSGDRGIALGQSGTQLLATAVQSNGYVIAVGERVTQGTPDLVVERLTPSGALDRSFGHAGLSTGPAVARTHGTAAQAVAIQPDGKIVVAGLGTGLGGVGTDGMLVERFNSNGSLDRSFGFGGVENLAAASSGAGDSVALQSDGDIVVGGSIALSAVPYAAVARLLPDGRPDPHFGTNGIDQLQLGQYATVQAVALQANGDIVLGGSTSPDGERTVGLIARLRSDGELDTTFHGTGAVTRQFALGTGAYSSINAVAVSTNGTVYAAGDATTSDPTAETFVAGYTATGAEKRSFGSSGVRYVASANNWEETLDVVPGARGLLLNAGGDLIVSGVYDNSAGTTYGTLWAFTPGGSVDRSFGSQGVAKLRLTNEDNSAFAGAALSPAGGVLVAAGAAGPVGGAPSGALSTFSANGQSAKTTLAASTGSELTAGTVTGAPEPTTAAPLTLAVTGLSTSYSAKQLPGQPLNVTAGCNQGCQLTLTLSATSATARHLDVPTRVTECGTVSGHRQCTSSLQFRALTLTQSVTLRTIGAHSFTVRISQALARAFSAHPGTKWRLSVDARATTKTVRARSYSTAVTFTS